MLLIVRSYKSVTIIKVTSGNILLTVTLSTLNKIYEPFQALTLRIKLHEPFLNKTKGR